jgi:hypothetical protein
MLERECSSMQYGTFALEKDYLAATHVTPLNILSPSRVHQHDEKSNELTEGKQTSFGLCLL